MRVFQHIVIVLSSLVLFTGCETVPPKENTAFIAAAPRSILVVPPANLSVEVNAPYTFLSTVSEPLAEKGYYVLPVAVIDRLFKENGVHTTEEMNRIPLDKIRENTGADAVMYVTINDWGQKFILLKSYTVVHADVRILDARDGAVLWATKIHATESYDGASRTDLLSTVIGAVADQIIGSLSDYTPDLSRAATNEAINDYRDGIPDGPYKIAAELAAENAKK